MPGKINPVAAKALNQACFYVYGMDTTVAWLPKRDSFS